MMNGHHRREDYAKVGIPMLPVTHGVAYTKLQILLYTLLLPGTFSLDGLVDLGTADARRLVWNAA